MRPTRDGNLPIHQSSTNRIILVTPDRPTATQKATSCAGPVRPGAAARPQREQLPSK
jgi:hypothetical protein